jgi:hypothetical protein
MENTLKELNSVSEQWTRQIQLLGQLSDRLLKQPFDETYEWTVKRTQTCLAEMSKLAGDLPNIEPFGVGYQDARSGLRICLAELQKTLKGLADAKQSWFAEGFNAGWERVLKSSRP